MSRSPIVVPDFARQADHAHWTTKFGQRVEKGVRVVEVICDKADFEVPALASGVLVEATIAFDAEVAVGQVSVGSIHRSSRGWASRRRSRPRSGDARIARRCCFPATCAAGTARP